MTADERLEKLLNRAGQTISDLPQNHFGLIGRVANLVDIIDRMETALENVIEERDWMVAMSGRIGFCFTCSHWNETKDRCELGGKCDPNSRETLLYAYSGVPDDWRADE